MQLLDDLGKQKRRNRQVVQRIPRSTEFLAQLGESCRVAIVAINVYFSLEISF
jgi:hypothetical protein